MNERTIVIVAADSDALPSQQQYFSNFVWAIRHALREHKIDARIVVAQSDGVPSTPHATNRTDVKSGT